MARSVATLSTSVRANTKGFRKGMRRAQTSLQKFRGAVVSAAKRAAKFGAVLTALATGAVSLMVRASFRAIDVTAKWADKLGIATEAIVGLQFAAKLSGVRVENFNMAMQRMTRRISEAASGTGEAQAILKELGLSAQRLEDIGPEKALLEMADAFDRLGGSSDTVRGAFKIFDSEGVALKLLFKDGAEGLRKMMERAKELGLTFSRIDAAKIELANNAVTELKASFVGIANTLAIAVAPAIEFLASLITDNIVNFRHDFINAIRGAVKVGIFGIKLFTRIFLKHLGVLTSELGGFLVMLSVAARGLGQMKLSKSLLSAGKKTAAFGENLPSLGDASIRILEAAFGNVMASYSRRTSALVGGRSLAVPGAGSGGGSGAAASFREVDLSRVSIGAGNTRKAQLVTDPATKRSASLLQKILNQAEVFQTGLR